MKISESLKNQFDSEFDALVNFARLSKVEHGFATMDGQGAAVESVGLELWINCRMTHVFCLATLRGDESARANATHGITSLIDHFYDAEFGGFFNAISPQGGPHGAVGERKLAYAHAFVLLAASSGIQTGIERAQELYELARAAHEKHFWDAEIGLVRESFTRDFSETEDYRGANANMHTIEASLAAWDATHDERWLAKAGSILMFVLSEAKKIGHRIPEHFDSSWNLVLDFNEDRPADPFRPFGLTPGHGLEWSRLALHYAAAVKAFSGASEEMVQGACLIHNEADELFHQSLADGWNVDGAEGIVYTTDFEGKPVVHERMHWTICEGISAAAAFGTEAEQEGNSERADEARTWIETFWAYATKYLIVEPGRWWHELNRKNEPSFITWPGKPDVYHAAQAMIIAELPVTPTFAGALAKDR